MCGIAGFWSTQPLEREAEGIVRNMTKIQRHRGPDGLGIYCDNEAGLALGHARLSVIDLETGQQPLHIGDGQVSAVINGEFYDYKRIRAQLICDGSAFRTKSDSEIALHLYQRYGLEFILHLRGEFAFALFDKATRRLILVRDRFGIRPLYYAILPQAIVFGSEIKGLLQHPGVPRAFNTQAVLHQLMHTMVPGTSLFEGIQAVQPGHMLVFSQRGDHWHLQSHQYWDMDFPKQHDYDHGVDPTNHITSLRQSLIEAVNLRLEADVPVGCYLSGGIDSCSMLGLAASVQQSPIKAFTISFDHDTYDEAPIAIQMAQKVHADHEILTLKAEDLYGDNFLTTLWHAERPFYNTLGVAKCLMSRRVRECGYKVVITGEGADELFGGYPAFKQDMFRHGLSDDSAGKGQEYSRELRQANAQFIGAILAQEYVSHPALEARCGFTPAWIQPWILTLAKGRQLLRQDILEELKGYDPIEAIAESFTPEKVQGRHPLDIAQYTWIKTMLECQILHWGGDRVDMANGMESRPAFLDHQLAEVARHIPPHYRIHQTTEKWILREAMRNILPDVLYRRQKMAFMAPPAHTQSRKRHALQQLIDQYLNPQHVNTVGLFDPRQIATFLSEYRADTDPASLVQKDALLNHVLGLHILHRTFIQAA
jgi:asparagine synthase (glutamine-hydrolysing)